MNLMGAPIRNFRQEPIPRMYKLILHPFRSSPIPLPPPTQIRPNGTTSYDVGLLFLPLNDLRLLGCAKEFKR